MLDLKSLLLAAAATCAAMAVSATDASAQTPRVMASVTTYSLNSDLTTRPLVGPGVHLFTPRSRSGFMLQFGLERLIANSNRFGYSCGGFLPPGPCQIQEPLRDRAKMLMLTTSGSLAVLTRPTVSISVLANVHGASIRVDTRGHESGRKLAGSDMLVGASVGGAVTWQPRQSVPIGLRGAVNAGVMDNLFGDECCDGYEPFAGDGFGMRQLTLGIFWARR